MSSTFEDLLSARAADAEVLGLPSGGEVKVRGVTRAEWLNLGRGEVDAATVEARLIKAAMVEPALTMAQIKAWQNNPGSMRDIGAVSDRIRELSGFGEGAQKSGVAEVRD